MENRLEHGKEIELINLTKDKAQVEINYTKSDRQGKIKLEIEDKKSFYINGIKTKKTSEILGKINIVMFNPDSIEISKEGPSKRRRFLDMLICQLKPSYLYNINQYIATLEQRNTYLRQICKAYKPYLNNTQNVGGIIKSEDKSDEMLDIWDEKLEEYGKKIYTERQIFLQKLREKIITIHNEITDRKEMIDIEYTSNFDENYLKELKNRRKLDIIKGYTSCGIHRDDFNIKINERNIREFGSQGQQRSSVISLKLAELEIIYEEIGEYPILLLDDFMSELDSKRRGKFLENIKENQVIITCTDKFKEKDSKVFHVENGIVIQKKD